MTCEIRDGRLHISGYVNAVERDSRVIMTTRGKCVEQVKAGAFAASMADGHEIRMMFNHKRDIGSTADGTLSLVENDIGLYAEAVTDDEELMELANKGELRGWSFGFTATDDEMEERSNNVPRRHVKALDLREVSILSVMPAYKGTSVEYRAYEEGEEDTKADELRAMAEAYRLKGYIIRKRTEQRELEERYNPYHNPVNGQFTSGTGGGYSNGGGLLYVARGQKSVLVGLSDEDVQNDLAEDVFLAEYDKWSKKHEKKEAKRRKALEESGQLSLFG